MKRLTSILLALALLLIPSAARALQSDSELSLRLTRDFGYGGFNNDIQGTFSYRAEGPDSLDRVEFYLDDELIATVDAAPFNYQFSTNDYPPGTHDMYAIGYTSEGAELRSNTVTRVFLSAEEARGATTGLVGPILGLVAVVMALSFAVPMLLNRGKKPKLGDYGVAGGAVCKNCGLPFSRAMWMPNMVVGKLGRCPHCGKIAILPRATPDQLEAAEARYRAEMEGGMASASDNDEERLKRQIDDSRYD